MTQPRETTIFDRTGNQGGLNFWPGLRVAVDRELQPMRLESPWVRHECNVCTKAVVRHGEEIVVQAAAVDGITAVRVQCCAVYNCTEDLLKQGGARRVPCIFPRAHCAEEQLLEKISLLGAMAGTSSVETNTTGRISSADIIEVSSKMKNEAARRTAVGSIPS